MNKEEISAMLDGKKPEPAPSAAESELKLKCKCYECGSEEEAERIAKLAHQKEPEKVFKDVSVILAKQIESPSVAEMMRTSAVALMYGMRLDFPLPRFIYVGFAFSREGWVTYNIDIGFCDIKFGQFKFLSKSAGQIEATPWENGYSEEAVVAKAKEIIEIVGKELPPTPFLLIKPLPSEKIASLLADAFALVK